jgi:hypothetical protein
MDYETTPEIFRPLPFYNGHVESGKTFPSRYRARRARLRVRERAPSTTVFVPSIPHVGVSVGYRWGDPSPHDHVGRENPQQGSTRAPTEMPEGSRPVEERLAPLPRCLERFQYEMHVPRARHLSFCRTSNNITVIGMRLAKQGSSDGL